MIHGIFYEGSGLGNQLHRYVMTRVLAADKGYEWGMKYTHFFKGQSFMKLDLGVPFGTGVWVRDVFQEKKVVENGVDIRSYDPEINFVEDNTVIDGEFQDERYFTHRLPEIAEWLKVEPVLPVGPICLIGFRGGEYSLFPDLFLQKEYWDKGIEYMRSIEPDMVFEVHTDDPALAHSFFPDFRIVDNKQISHSKHTNMGMNWRAMRYAKYAIIANSSFYILPRLLAHQEQKALTIAPRYWARRYAKVWAQPQNYYKKFTYL